MELPDQLIAGWHNVYVKGEKMGCEWGESLTLQDTGSLKIKRSEGVKGTAISCDVPRTTNDLEFGDMHSHPSLSIGHLNGYSPHSIEDWTIFQYHLSKPVFMRFVASGDYLYAVVYRKGVSQYLGTLIDSSLAFHTMKLNEYSERFNLTRKKLLIRRFSTSPSPVALEGEDEIEVDDRGHELEKQPIYLKFRQGRAREEWVQDVDPIEEQNALLRKKMNTPGFGEYLMKLAGLNNVELAKRLKFGFYMGHRKKDKGLLRLTDKWTGNL